jgi:hypothetical protein
LNPGRRGGESKYATAWPDITRALNILLGEIGWDGMDWIERVQDRDQWRALVNKVMNLRVP